MVAPVSLRLMKRQLISCQFIERSEKEKNMKENLATFYFAC